MFKTLFTNLRISEIFFHRVTFGVAHAPIHSIHLLVMTPASYQKEAQMTLKPHNLHMTNTLKYSSNMDSLPQVTGRIKVIL